MGLLSINYRNLANEKIEEVLSTPELSMCLCRNASKDLRVELLNRIFQDGVTFFNKEKTIDLFCIASGNLGMESAMIGGLKHLDFKNLRVFLFDAEYTDTEEKEHHHSVLALAKKVSDLKGVQIIASGDVENVVENWKKMMNEENNQIFTLVDAPFVGPDNVFHDLLEEAESKRADGSTILGYELNFNRIYYYGSLLEKSPSE